LLKRLLVLDTSFSFESIVERGLESSVTCRDLDGFFDHVWTVHPFASIVTSSDWAAEFGKPVIYSLGKSHTFVEGKIGRTEYLKKIPPINFLLAQFGVLIFLYKLINKERISIIRVGDPLYLGLLGYVLSKLTGVPFVVRIGANNQKIRENTKKCMMPRLFKSMYQERMVERFVLSRADLVAAANIDNQNFAIESGANPDKCTLFRYGNLIDAIHFSDPAQRPVIKEFHTHGIFLLCIARLELVKKVDDVIRVLAEVRASGFDAKVLLVGDGRERENLKMLAQQLDVLNHVVFCGNRDQCWLSSIIPHAAVVISPHTGRALTEAGLGGAAIAAYDVDWQAELIETGVTGEIVSFGDWRALATSTIRLLSQKDYARSMGVNLRRKVLEMMDPEKLNEHERQQYTLILNKFNNEK
jgi:glycosyltransferase involved in cell wall biosynthesis